MNRISACLITFNEEHNLPRALASLAGVADEVGAVVVPVQPSDSVLVELVGHAGEDSGVAGRAPLGV